MTSSPARVPWFPSKQPGEMPSAAGRQADRVLLGIGLMIGATFFLTLSNVLSKSLVVRYPVGEVMVFRSAVALAIC